MSFLYTTIKLHHITPLPAIVTYEVAVKATHDHNRHITSDPEHVSHEELPRETVEKPFTAALDSDTKRYRCKDNIQGLPKVLGLPQTITFDSEITNVENGIDWVVKAPMGLIQRNSWKIVKRDEAKGTPDQVNDLVEDGGEWALVEDVEIEANRLLAGTVKSKCESDWRGIQKNFIDHLVQLSQAK